MPTIDYARRTVLFRVVYEGAAMAGRLANLERMHRCAPPDQRTQIVSAPALDGRFTSCEIRRKSLVVEISPAFRLAVHVELSSIPSTSFSTQLRPARVALADAIVHVVDSRPERLEANLVARDRIAEWLARRPDGGAGVVRLIQYNKRDVPDAMSIEELRARLGTEGLPEVRAIARTGEGVRDTFETVTRMLIEQLRRGAPTPPSARREEGATEAQLLREVVTSPLRDGPRRRFADLVGGDRADFIRAQLEAARWDRSASRGDYGIGRPGGTRVVQLLRAHGARWAGPAIVAHASGYDFYRGFVERIVIDARKLLAHGDEILASAPILEVALRGVLAAGLEDVFGSPLLGRVMALDLSGEKLGDAGAIAIARSPHLGGLRWLSLFDNDIGATGSEALVTSGALAQLGFLAFGENRLDPTPSAGGIDPFDGAIMAWDFTDHGAAMIAAHGARPWQTPTARYARQWPPSLHDLVCVEE
ncbi:MAG: hypothetical protein IT379_27400 [Deltaproteobacteria bacterium]|nr:hypothetical protein [Deltaproteobacteria bacterium]